MKGCKICPEKENPQRSEAAAETWTWVVDMEGCTWGDAPSLQVLRKLDEELFTHYPGRLEKVLFVNVPGSRF